MEREIASDWRKSVATRSDPRTLNQRRARQRNIGAVLTIAGFLILVLSPARAPLPFNVAVEIVLGAALIIVGLAFWRGAHALPVREILLLAQEFKGELTARRVVEEMGLEPRNAEFVLDRLVEMGYLRRDFVSRNSPPRYVISDKVGPDPWRPEDDISETE
jgi:hypothetical protein